ncbi:hypothetical protein PENTCL1PPCAC_15759 [Pristionchus entomophagus]|uniref:G protein-coupled receptor n=1 Tax=Pristionchus entomophagus TaxID=358040 RepID=A0AAV5TFX1_9BILA|nr:hypothetical protein PENTCL1PPCAC_15759 [Pristionchus entomophagus]
MSAVLNATSVLDRYPILQIVQIFPVSFAFPSLIFVFTYLNRIALHMNCRVLMFMWIGAFIVMVTINFLMALFDLCAGHYNPQMISETEWGPYLYRGHGMTHAFSSVQELYIAVERAVASHRPAKYHNRPFDWPSFLLFEGIAIAWTYCYMLIIQTDNFFYIGAASNTVDTSALLCMIFGSRFIRKMKNVQHDTLNAKYQIREASIVSHIILVIGFVSLFTKMSAMIWVWLYVMGFAPFAIITTSAVLMHTVNCGIVGYLFIWMHDGLKKRAVNFSRIYCRAGSIRPAMMRYADIALRSRYEELVADTEIHFSELARSWA